MATELCFGCCRGTDGVPTTHLRLSPIQGRGSPMGLPSTTIHTTARPSTRLRGSRILTSAATWLLCGGEFQGRTASVGKHERISSVSLPLVDYTPAPLGPLTMAYRMSAFLAYHLRSAMGFHNYRGRDNQGSEADQRVTVDP